MSEPFIGEIQMFGFNFAPRGWAFCDGQLLPIAENSALFALLGTMYGGDGRTTFALPDLRGRAPIHRGHGPGLSDYKVGQTGGSETNTLNVNQLASHNHAGTGTVQCVSGAGDANIASGNFPSADAGTGSATYNSGPADAQMAANGVVVTTQGTGGGQPVNNMQPYLAVNFCIALQGIFPSRS